MHTRQTGAARARTLTHFLITSPSFIIPIAERAGRDQPRRFLFGPLLRNRGLHVRHPYLKLIPQVVLISDSLYRRYRFTLVRSIAVPSVLVVGVFILGRVYHMCSNSRGSFLSRLLAPPAKVQAKVVLIVLVPIPFRRPHSLSFSDVSTAGHLCPARMCEVHGSR